MPIMFASILTTLTACDHSANYAPPDLPDETQDLKDCTSELVPGIPGTPGQGIPKSQTSMVIGEQRTSALSKDKCAHDWRAFYADLDDLVLLTIDPDGLDVRDERVGDDVFPHIYGPLPIKAVIDVRPLPRTR